MSETPVPLKPAATLLLIREGDGLEVLMIKRNRMIDFAAGAMVFPGGKVCADDKNPVWGDMFIGEASPDARAFQIAAIREVFEETGILLAQDEGGHPVSPERVLGLGPHRAPIDQGEALFSDLIAREQLRLDGAALIPFGNWRTPAFMSKRFNTFFYLARMPDGQTAIEDGREATEISWTRPDAALEAASDGRATIIFPTRMNLGRLALESDCDEALQRFATDCAPTIEPVVDKSDPDNPVLIIPDVEGYPQTREPLTRVKDVARPVRPGT